MKHLRCVLGVLFSAIPFGQAPAVAPTADTVVVVTGVKATGLYHRDTCPWVKGVTTRLAFTVTQAQKRYFQAHCLCMTGREDQPPCDSAPSSAVVSAPVTPAPAIAPAPIPAETFSIVEVGSKVTEQNATWWRYAWKLTLRSVSAQRLALSAAIEFQDSGGFIVDSDSPALLVLDAYGTETFTGFALVRMPGATNVTRTVANVKVVARR